MICPGCGREIDEKSLKCPFCGYKFETSYNLKSEPKLPDDEDTAEFKVPEEERKAESHVVETFQPSYKEEEGEESYFLAWLMFYRGGNYLGYKRIKREKVFIGNSPEAEVPVDDLKASRIHAFLYIKNEKFYIEDLKSLSGTFINGKKIETTTLIHDGDKIKIGDTEIILKHVKELKKWLK